MEKKILILVPGHGAKGGIDNYYKALENKFFLDIDYFVQRTRSFPKTDCIIIEVWQTLKDIVRFYKLIGRGEHCLVQTTTSLSLLSLLRDALFVVIAKVLKLKVIVFFRGWDDVLAAKIERRYLGLFKLVFFRADAIIDLCEANSARLSEWGYEKKIYLETTVVDEELIKSISLESIKLKHEREADNLNILFLARVEVNKGVYEAVEAYSLLKRKYDKVRLTIAGDGFELDRLKNYVKERAIEGVTFVGFVAGEEKVDVYKAADIYILPSYFEGMPTSVLEAMAFGLPIVTRTVGGVEDFFINGSNGFMTKSKESSVFAKLIERIVKNKDLMFAISMNNYNLAQERFLSKKVAERIDNIFSEVITQR